MLEDRPLRAYPLAELELAFFDISVSVLSKYLLLL